MVDRIAQALRLLREESESNALRAEKAEDKAKSLEEEVVLLQHRLATLDVELIKATSKLAEQKLKEYDGDQSGNKMAEKVQLLEEELSQEKNNLKETTEKLRQADIKVEHLERWVIRLEQESTLWEKKYEDTIERHKLPNKELEDYTNANHHI
ncbi:tropomyosin [Flagelloscypha sp. PMI_526]|nr:tropomyosin [Flagelloscypha sp. PMI_526]